MFELVLLMLLLLVPCRAVLCRVNRAVSKNRCINFVSFVSCQVRIVFCFRVVSWASSNRVNRVMRAVLIVSCSSSRVGIRVVLCHACRVKLARP